MWGREALVYRPQSFEACFDFEFAENWYDLLLKQYNPIMSINRFRNIRDLRFSVVFLNLLRLLMIFIETTEGKENRIFWTTMFTN